MKTQGSARAGRASGSVEQPAFEFFRGTMPAFAPPEAVGTGDMTAWMSLCFNAWRSWNVQRVEAGL